MGLYDGNDISLRKERKGGERSMILRCRISRVLSRAVLLAPLTWAQDAFLVRWETLRSVQPAGVELRIAAPKAAFYSVETIPLTLSFTATNLRSFVADSRLQDPVGRMNYIEEFVPDSATAEDPLRGLPGETGGMGSLSGGNAILSSDKPFTVERILNEWVRVRAPGRYRIYVFSRRVRQVTGTGQAVTVPGWDDVPHGSGTVRRGESGADSRRHATAWTKAAVRAAGHRIVP